VEPLGGEGAGVVKARPGLHLRPLFGVELALLERDARRARELLHGFSEAQALGLHQEGEDVAGLFAAEAVVDLLVAKDVEARAFLLVERAEPDGAAALAAQRHRLADHLGDVGALADLVDEGAGDLHWPSELT
jgi:hypothetical protein